MLGRCCRVVAQRLRANRGCSEAASRLHTTADSDSDAGLLHYEEVPPSSSKSGGGEEEAPLTLCLLHGLLGVGRNLRSVASMLCKEAEQESGSPWRAVLVDQRNHGRSARVAGLHPPHTLAASARDLFRLFKQRFGGVAPQVLAGHSMGGKVVLEAVRQLAQAEVPPQARPQQVWVLDARPGRVEHLDAATQDVLKVVHEVAAIPLPIPSCEWLYNHLQQRGFSLGLQHWLGSNLMMEAQGQYSWAFNVQGARQMFEDYLHRDYWDLLHAPPPGVTINLVRAMRSDRWDQATMQQLRSAVAATAKPSAARGSTRYWELPDAGHWLHSDNPKGLVQLMLPSLLQLGAAPSSSSSSSSPAAAQ